VQAEVARVLSFGSPREVPVDKPLKDLGLDSLMAVELGNALSRRSGATIPATLAFNHPTPAAIANYLLSEVLALVEPAVIPPIVERAAFDEAAAIAQEKQLWADAVLDPGIQRISMALPALAPASVLLTGATGFLGAYLLRDLLQLTHAHINCHVRAADAATGIARVVENLRHYGLWQDAFLPRLSILPGDLRQPHLGLERVTWDRLAQSLDAIYNNGALLGFIAGYRELKPSHVHPANEILRLASNGRPKTVHHVSSTAVFDSAAYRRQTIAESMNPVDNREIYLGYSQSKWVSETLMREAASRGLPVTIHRPAFISGSSIDGAFNTADFLARMFKAIIETGLVPGDLDAELDVSPVDYVSRSIVCLSLRPSSIGRTFHLQHPRSIHIETLTEFLRAAGYKVRSVPYWDWVACLETLPDGPLAPLLPLLVQRWGPEQLTYMEFWQRRYRPRFTCDETLQALDSSSIVCPALDRVLMERYLRYLSSTGFITAPPLLGP
jgi:thioester reductase-like protein